MPDQNAHWAAGQPIKIAGAALLERLKHGWTSNSSLPRDFTEAWQTLFESHTHSLVADANVFEFSTELANIKLRGMDNILCLCIAGDQSETAADLAVWRTPRALGRTIFIIAFTEPATLLFDTIPHDRCLKLAPSDIESLFNSPDPASYIKQALRNQFSCRRLIPYDIGHSPQSHMFHGRHKQLAELTDNPNTSYAIVGPIGIGKTTLLRQYKNLMLKQKDPRAHRLVYVNFAYCTNPDDDFAARFMAMAVDPSSRSNSVKLEGLAQVIRRLQHVLDGAPEILCDEVDDFCQGKLFQVLGSLMREGHCRLLLGGRSQLYRLVTQELQHDTHALAKVDQSVNRREGGSTIERRQLAMRLGPLDIEDARQLIATPFADLGLSIETSLMDQVLTFTGRIPHLIQYCAIQLIEEAMAAGSHDVTVQHFDSVRWNFDAGQFFTDPLRNFDTAETKFMALICLSKVDTTQVLSITELQDLAKAEGLDRTLEKTKMLCDELVINNVLSWAENRYRLATAALSYYVRDWGYLDQLLYETKLHLGISCASR